MKPQNYYNLIILLMILNAVIILFSIYNIYAK